ncbi:HAD family hydrolase [Nonomuraea sp. LPB2021202275-12-8]|uniref:HAD family hydrolase n=1 Tax=Nonomuraea sp. LPB2021202275-12-8 TaxID=3120159 RepID=UPI00300C6130
MNWILFDYGNVLSLAQPAADAEAMAGAAGADPVAFRSRYWQHRLEFDGGSLSPADYWTRVAGRPLGGAEVARLIDMDVASWAHPDEGTVTLLGELLAAGRDVALLSNAPACVADGLDELPWIAGIPRRFYSGRLGLVKPGRQIYDLVARELGAAPARVVFVDDRPENVAGAEAAGMTGVRFTGADALREVLRP